MKVLLFVGLGGFLGSTSRYLIAQFFVKFIPEYNSLGTLTVNILGSLILGVLMNLSDRFDRELYLFLTVGFCGGFTTFSTFSVENIRYIMNGNVSLAFIYICISLTLGILAAALGWYLSKNLI